MSAVQATDIQFPKYKTIKNIIRTTEPLDNVECVLIIHVTFRYAGYYETQLRTDIIQ